MSQIQDRLAELFPVQPRGLQAEIARVCKVRPPSVSAWFNNPEKVAAIDIPHAEAICAKYRQDINPRWLADGSGDKFVEIENRPASTVEETLPIRVGKRVPIVGTVKGGTDGYLDEFQYPVGHGDGYVEYWTPDASAYALRVVGDSMHPRYRAGEYIVVTPSIEAQPGKDVVVKLRDGRKLLKELAWVHDMEVKLLSINNGVPAMTIDRREIESIHRVGGRVDGDALIRNS